MNFKLSFPLSLCLAATITCSALGADQPFQTAINQLVYQIRNPETKGPQFRDALEKIGEYLGIQAMDRLNVARVDVQTLTNTVATHFLVEEQIVLVTILRAGIPLCLGVHKVFPEAEVGFIAMSRNEETLQPLVEYIALPEIQGKTVIVADTMIATAGSVIDAIRILQTCQPKKILVIGAIAAEPGIARIAREYPEIQVIAAVVDPALNDKGYIIPGLGDAGDRAFGCKNLKCITSLRTDDSN